MGGPLRFGPTRSRTVCVDRRVVIRQGCMRVGVSGGEGRSELWCVDRRVVIRQGCMRVCVSGGEGRSRDCDKFWYKFQCRMKRARKKGTQDSITVSHPPKHTHMCVRTYAYISIWGTRQPSNSHVGGRGPSCWEGTGETGLCLGLLCNHVGLVHTISCHHRIFMAIRVTYSRHQHQPSSSQA